MIQKIKKKILVTGSSGFVGKNLVWHLQEKGCYEIVTFSRDNDESQLGSLLCDVDFIVHLAGVNRPLSEDDFSVGNLGLTSRLCKELEGLGRAVPIIYSSSTQAVLDNPYGKSKIAAENCLRNMAEKMGAAVYIFRLPNVFGKWCKPNYNSAVATFCHNVARDLPITINNRLANINLVYVDDVVNQFVKIIEGETVVLDEFGCATVSPVYSITVGDLADQIVGFKKNRKDLYIGRVGSGLTRALHATYLSYLPVDAFSYTVPRHEDTRGVFVEMLKTADSGQFSFFTAAPGVTRGGHYHHSKTEKFLLVKGQALFKFKNIVSGEFHQISVSADESRVIETVPGWTHDVTNCGPDDMVMLLWANEVFDRANPDTFSHSM